MSVVSWLETRFRSFCALRSISRCACSWLLRFFAQAGGPPAPRPPSAPPARANARLRRSAAALAIATSLCAACATKASDDPCPFLIDYAPSFAEALAREVEALPEDSAIVTALSDYVTLRAQVRACHGAYAR